MGRGFPLSTLLHFSPGTESQFARDLLGQGNSMRKCGAPMDRSKHELQSVMGGLYLGVAVAGVEALIAMGLVIAFM
jgi:hypothetical protein